MSRYPYTEAYDALRSIPEKAEDGMSTKLGRSESAQLISFIASAIGCSAEELATKIADYAKRSPGCGQCGASTVETCNDNGCFFLENGNGEPESRPC